MGRVMKPGQTIGILGGGQLGRMMAFAAKPMGYRVAVLEPKSDSPAGQVADIEIEASYDDRDGADSMAEVCDVLTYEFENIDAETARLLENTLYLPQGSQLLHTAQHRLREKQAIEAADIKVAPYHQVTSREELSAAVEQIGVPSVLKTCRGGYDGKGQVVLKAEEDAEAAFEALGGSDGKELVLEAWIPFQKEISCIVTRSVHGETGVFPVGENIHVNNVLHQTIVPARISRFVNEEAIRIAHRLAEHVDLVGTLAVEMFVTDDDTVYVNEVAPRPHNSGHYTIEACETSQFEQHIRAVCGLPLGPAGLKQPVVMTNILGEHVEAVTAHMEEWSKDHVHLYGKDEAKPGRKMGHWTVLREDLQDALERSSDVWKQYIEK
ncbi:5-(carboxyamino)imidazole ribonucleotide synthase [Marinococcus sp. PL1-022]|uniref:5-(carboxyamino)imidazole ribonucleotide synthase n=1 Tax=Marinococcus sp. PL1-022 TaxID=3095363 RepID=UPI0029C3185F|nr:5-(carboxyamino)imidazole ribonucleotide synthase [Marinococcus sp. PL1-022]MDX6153631.1 5-(carboxyamino)imidazole ribonucleotide synthase [Marinococcus sp. PL1-022]